jgi:hypothetical protein
LASASTSFLITVTPVNDPPSIAWIGLANGALLAAGQLTLNVSASDPDANLAAVQYFVDGALFGQTTNPPFTFLWTNAPMGYHRIEARATDTTGLSGVTSNLFVSVLGAPMTFVYPGALWKYWDRGTLPATNWFSPACSDATWSAGPSPLGYGDANGIWPATTNYSGPTNTDKYVTTYYRSSFNLAEAASVTNLLVSIQRDDGAIVYLNGAEIYRNNMPTGAVSYGTWATGTISGTDEVAWYTNTVNPALLVNGANVLAAEIHQVTNTSSDIFFNLRLTAQPTLHPPAIAAVARPGDVQISWPAWAAGLALWCTDDLEPPVTWAPVTNALSNTNGEMTVTAPVVEQGRKFFQLRSW